MRMRRIKGFVVAVGESLTLFAEATSNPLAFEFRVRAQFFGSCALWCNAHVVCVIPRN